MKKSKFLIPLLLVLVVFLAACGRGNDAGTGQGAGAAGQGAGGALPPLTTENIELVFTTFGVDQPVLDLVAEAFTRNHPNIVVHAIELNTFYYSDNFHLMAADGMLPDVFKVQDIVGWTLNGWLMDITELVDNDPRVDLIGDAYMHLGQFHGVRTALPIYSHPILAVLNVDYFDRFNEPIPTLEEWNWDLALEIAERISRPQEMMFGIGKSGFFATENYLHNARAFLSGDRARYGWLQGDGYVFCQDWIDLVNLRNDLHARGIIDNATAEQKYSILGENVNLADRGFTAISFKDFWEVDDMLAAPFDVVVYPFPTRPGGRQPVGSDMAGISAITPHPREAYEFLMFFYYSDEAWAIKLDWWADGDNELGQWVDRMPNSAVGGEARQRFEEVFGVENWAAIYNATVNNAQVGTLHTPGVRAFQRWRGEGGYWGQLLNWSAPELFPVDVADEFTTRINDFYRIEMDLLEAVMPTLNRFTW